MSQSAPPPSKYLETAAYLAYYAYTDEDADPPTKAAFDHFVQKITANGGGWSVVWGPATESGFLAYAVKSAEGTIGVGFRGTDTDFVSQDFYLNWFYDLDAFALENYLPVAGSNLQISCGTKDGVKAVALMVDSKSGQTLLKFLQGQATTGGTDLVLTGHSLGGALTIAVTKWISFCLDLPTGQSFNYYPYTFAAPTISNDSFATDFQNRFPNYYAAVNEYDIIPMAWANLGAIYNLYPSPGPGLSYADPLYSAIWYAEDNVPTYTPIVPGVADTFPGPLFSSFFFVYEAGYMHSMQYSYMPRYTGNVGEKLFNSVQLPRPRALRRRLRRPVQSV